MLRDLQHTLRMLVDNKGWTAVIVLSLALGIGANTTLFTAANAVLLETLPVPEPDMLVRLKSVGDNEMARSSSEYGWNERNEAGQSVRATFSYRTFQDLRVANQTLTDLFACAPGGSVNVVIDGDAEISSAFLVSGNYFDVLGVPALLGRTITMEDDDEAAAPVAMISHGFWTRRFGMDPEVVGRVVTINDTAVTIIGVIPAAFTGVQRPGGSLPDIHLPLALVPRIQDRNPERLNEGTTWWLQMMGRLRPGVTPEQVRGNLEGVFQQSARDASASFQASLSPEERAQSRNQRDRTAVPNLQVTSGNRGVYDPAPNATRGIRILGAVVLLVLIIVCANVANLLLSRATTRRKEMSVRLSMGATRTRLVRQLLTESLVLSLIGGAFGVLVSYWSRPLLPFGQGADFSWPVFAFVAGLSLLTAVAFGLFPALRATRVDLSSSLKETSRSVSHSRSLLSKSLLILQVAISLVLMIGAGLLLGTLQNLRTVEVGFNPGNLLLFQVSPGLIGYEGDGLIELFERLEDELTAIPDVRSASMSQTALLSGNTWIGGFVVDGQGEDSNRVNMMTVSPSFFETMDIPVLTGRSFTSADSRNAPKVAIINGTAAEDYFEQERPLGQRIGFSPEESGHIEIIGIIGDTKYSSVRDAAPATMYLPFAQRIFTNATFELRTIGDPEVAVPAVREAVRRIEPDLEIRNISTQIESIERLFSQERLFAMSYSLFGVLALLLASIGLFGLMSYTVGRRTNEIGVRMAMGARRWDVTGMVLRESLILVSIGVAIGLAGAWAAGRLITSLLFGVTPMDPITIGAAVLVMVSVCALASYLPARRASRVNPMVALRHE